jgi:uncharacterized membrane protein HdeD (DUF308 family)
MAPVVCRKWWVLLLRGLAAIALGVTAVLWPGITLVSLMLVFATFALLQGIGEVVLGMRGEADGTVWWTMVLLGILSIASAIVAAAWPGLTALVLLAIIAVSAIVRGIFEIAAAVSLRKQIDDEWVLVLSGVLSIAFGAILIARPGAGAVAMVLLIGAYMMAMGVMAVALSLRLRKLQHKLAAHAAPSGR